jgi:outer membrane protein
MIMNLKAFLIPITLFFFAVGASAQTVWTLEQCVKRSLENNLTIKQGEIDQQVAEQNVLQSKLGVLPSVNASGSQNYNFGRSVDAFTNDFTTQTNSNTNLGLNANLILFNGLQRANSIKQSNFYLQASQSNLQNLKDNITLSVVNGYLSVLFANELVIINTNQVDISRQQTERMKILVDAGSATEGMLLETQAQLALEELNLTNAENQQVSAILSMKQLLELEPNADFTVEKIDGIEPGETLKKYNEEEVFQQALQINPQIKSAKYNQQAVERDIAIARASNVPRLSVNGGINTGYSSQLQRITSVTPSGSTVIGTTEHTGENVVQPNFNVATETTPFADQFDQNLSQYIGLTLSIPVFNGWQGKSATKRAKLSNQRAELSTDIAKNNLQKTIYQLVADHKAAQKRFTSSTNSVTSLRKSFNYNDERYKLGMINSVDYNLSKNNLIRAESDLLQAKYDLIFKAQILEYYQGKAIDF